MCNAANCNQCQDLHNVSFSFIRKIPFQLTLNESPLIDHV